jgi:hypothetical protein
VIADFRQFVPAADHPKVAGLSGMDAHAYAARALQNPWIREWTGLWREAYGRPFFGITTDGSCIPGLFPLADEDAPVAAMTASARRLLDRTSAEQRRRLCHTIDAAEWRIWSNPEFYINQSGIRLEEEPDLQEAIFELLRTSLSARGYAKIRAVMKINAFLGVICNARGVMNEFSYNFTLFGTPHEDTPWGWQLFGHHLVLNCFVLGRQMVLSPCFLGSEPNVVDAGPDAGLSVFRDVSADERSNHAARPLPPLRSASARRRISGQPYHPLRRRERRAVLQCRATAAPGPGCRVFGNHARGRVSRQDASDRKPY